MAHAPLASLIDRVGRLAAAGDGAACDGELLGRYLDARDPEAFAALVRRHGPMVLGVCRRVLRGADADDAFQATFLVLVKKAATVSPRTAVGGWLHGVAYHTAARARTAASRRRRREVLVPQLPDRPAADTPATTGCDAVRVLDRELAALPDRYRLPVVLCDLEGLTRSEAAARLGWPEGTVAGRLARARKLLADRLARRGVTHAGAVLASAVSTQAVAAPLFEATIRAAAVFAAGGSVGPGVSAAAVALSHGVIKTMYLAKLKKAALAVVALAGVGVGTWAGLGGPDAAQADPGRTPPAVALVAARAPVPATPAGDAALEALWADLGSPDEATSARAMLRLAAAAKDAVPFLAAKLRAATGKVDDKKIDELVKGLAAEKEDDRTRAVAALADLADHPAVRAKLKEFADRADAGGVVLAARALVKKPTGDLYPLTVKSGGVTVTMASASSISVTEMVNGGGSGRSQAGGAEAEHLKEVIAVAADPNREASADDRKGRTVRAVTLLAHLGTPEAVKALDDLAAGDEKSPLTAAAKDALKRGEPKK
ncbi:sigma-70 family rna polymerase sigma factor : RNA polymerase sigma factor, sigma-70 family OS=Singulisphaera acidiphila (strain ATCC BAA-1392 / DSM 18658 / VKM B-2454 / MOB10) GN=Sinac_6419 PE=4 SV=1: Sigma70_r2: Sigma70_r4_2 [Gemmataceae bacterium]|nr:sigma-70 family rna polymerase sigma factor : RNA polymerase sigma factor, sigma-70 family OS=Singulisphaera acidiphila (strain ATCC BAA-1392 / DSM 18658 / VKM B-2454 / MOB10) GN=Sinac_6419 PE=4 SV=1: Sigma70_r2: Sigma70_r4_2 [Gemmataceae bacterium]VTT98073.1 sigma-70 family rna polymerase sigma factor : RNA polymerase sigma factor, sigma-70 family OS=Singulisphaera acidiphila (strain ATCC BAA-1392 / DSM 18658 / VKM B-2454 / MOB10) GN=Sinac_6419 PE=4 SV=1: Sigma70_r2: Sigma70_r4_2 [Gemmataceae 